MDTEIPKKVQNFFSKFEEITFRKGDVILTPTDTLTNIFFLTKGLVRMYSLSNAGEEITLTVFKQETYFPIMLVLGGATNTYFFQAEEEIHASKAPISEVLLFLKSNNDILFDLTSRFAMAINGLTKRIEVLTTEASFKQVVNLLLHFSRKFGPEIQMTHKEMSQWLGLSRETVSRHLAKLAQDKIITTSNNSICISNPYELKNLL